MPWGDPFIGATIEWGAEKYDLVRENRNIRLEDVVKEMKDGNTLAILDHPNKERYPNQKIAVVKIDWYAVAVPYIEWEWNRIFIKTAFPCRAYKKYLQ